MEIITPGFGLIFWTAILFLIVLFILSKTAFKPIAKALKNRENQINESLKEAKMARQEVGQLQERITRMEKESRQKREQILKDAKEVANAMINKAKHETKTQQDNMMEEALNAIENEKKSAIKDIKSQVAILSLEIAEKILKNQLSQDETQKALVNDYIKSYNLNSV